MARRPRPSFTKVGKTKDGKTVVSGLFRLMDTQGIPLDIILEFLQISDLVPSWTHFYKEAVVSGWTHKTTILRMETVITDIYGIEYWLVVKNYLSTHDDAISYIG
jgi:hypothetical protein